MMQSGGSRDPVSAPALVRRRHIDLALVCTAVCPV
jgi:hypothetical protein